MIFFYKLILYYKLFKCKCKFADNLLCSVSAYSNYDTFKFTLNLIRVDVINVAVYI